MRSERPALRIGAARLLEHVVELAGRAQEAPRVGRGEGAVRVGVEHDVVAGEVAHRREPLRVGVRIYPDLDLDPVVALGEELPGERQRFFQRRDDHDVVERHGVAVPGAELLPQRATGRPCLRIPAGHVDRGLRIRMAAQPRVEERTHGARLRRVRSEQRGRELCDPGPGSAGEGLGVHGVDQARLAVAGDPLVGVEADDERVEAGRDARAHAVPTAAEGL